MFGYRNLGFGAFPNRDVTFSVANSALFNDGDSDHLTRDFTKLGNQFRWTVAFWFKIGVIDGRKHFFGQDDSYISINENSSTSHKINIYNVGRGAASGSNVAGWYWETAALFRDPHAWYHLVVAFDSLQSDAADALRVYANGTELTSFDPKHSNGSQYNGTVTNAGFHDLGSAESMIIGKHPVNNAQYWDGYLAQYVYINGYQLAPTSFGEFDTAGRWKPKDLTDTLAVSSTSEAIVNVASAVDTMAGGDTNSSTFSSVALGTASSTREAYVFISGQENSGTAGTITATMNTGSGAVAMTKIMDVNNATEAHYQGSLFKISVPSGTTGDIAASMTRNFSQLGVIVWTVTGDHHLFDIVADADTSSSTTLSVSMKNVPAGSVILAGRTSAGSNSHTWSSNLTENIDQVIEGTVRHTGASTATTNGGDFTITCVPDSSGSDARGRMFAIALSPNQGAGRNGFYLPFTSTTNIGQDESQDFDTTTTSANFDGTNDYLARGADLTSISDGTEGTLSVFYRCTGRGSDHRLVISSADGYQTIGIENNNKWRVNLLNSSGSEVVDLQSTNAKHTADGVWHHFISSWNTATDSYHMYVDGIDVRSTLNATTDGIIDYTRGEFEVGRYNTLAARKWQGDLAELYFTTEFVDLSSITNRLKFLAADGKPANLGADGSTPTGTQPLLYLANPFGTFQNNLGSGGNLTENGELTEGRTVRSAFANDFTSA